MSNPSSLSPLPEDDFWMRGALKLARRGIGLAHPNPLVGAVVVREGRVLGEGFHTWERRGHAETLALEKAGAEARGATLYVNLEPCCHTGRTPPCTKTIIAAGIRRVVAAVRDPNPLVAGRGLRELQRAGIEVLCGVCGDEARRLNEDFACWIRARHPFVILKTAATLDGQIGSRGGSTTRITSPESHEEVQRLRHAADALLTGIGTVLADDPHLTDRSGGPRRKALLRVVVDSRLRMPLKSRLVREAAGDLLVFTAQSGESPKAKVLRRAGVEIVQAGGAGERVDLRKVIRELGRREILNVLLEAGAELNGASLRADIVDKLVLFLAPKIAGGGHIPIARSYWPRIAAAPTLRLAQLRFSGPDAVLEGYFHDVYGNRPGHRKN